MKCLNGLLISQHFNFPPSQMDTVLTVERTAVNSSMCVAVNSSFLLLFLRRSQIQPAAKKKEVQHYSTELL
jgi:hypothetical protein